MQTAAAHRLAPKAFLPDSEKEEGTMVDRKSIPADLRRRMHLAGPRVIYPAPLAAIGEPAPDFELPAVVQGEQKSIRLSDYKGRWLVFAFYPEDFSWVCPTEIASFNDSLDKFRACGCEVVMGSTVRPRDSSACQGVALSE